jgi:hypothetical protein
MSSSSSDIRYGQAVDLLKLIEPAPLFTDQRKFVADELPRALALNITSEATLKEAVALTGKVKGQIKIAETQRKDSTSGVQAYVNRVQEVAREVLNPLKKGEATLKSEMSQYQTIVAKEQAEARAKLEKALVENVADPEARKRTLDEMTGPSSNSVSSSGTNLHQRTQWDFSVEDLNQVPRKYLKLDEPAVRKAIREGERNIAGIKVSEKSVMVIRNR